MSQALQRVDDHFDGERAERPLATRRAMEPAGDNATAIRVHRLADTNDAAVYRQVQTGDLVTGGLAFLGARVIDRSERLIQFGYDRVRAQRYEADQADMERVVQKQIDTTAEEMNRSYRTTAQLVRRIQDRELVLPDERTFGEQLRDEVKAWFFGRGRPE